MSRGPGEVQRWVIDYLKTDADLSRPWQRWVDVRWLAKCFVHRECCRDDVDDVRVGCITPEPTRSQVEAVRRAVKTLGRSGAIELEHRQIEIMLCRSGYGIRTFLCCRLPLSVEEREECAAHQRLEDERLNELVAEAYRSVASL